MDYKRLFNLDALTSPSGELYGASAFLFGPRMVGKTRLLKAIEGAARFDLLSVDDALRYQAEPALFWNEIRALPGGKLVIIDEVQKVPSLLEYVQRGIEEKGLRFILSGSSARKLRRGGALDFRLHPLTERELGSDFELETALRFGTLPRICTDLRSGRMALARETLKSYVTTYIREEIQIEATVRNIPGFQRFLSVAAQSNGQVIEFSTISRDCGVAASTVKEFYQVLEDTLIGRFLWPMDRSERKKARPKFYFFDCGVVRAIQNRLQDPPTPEERGFLFETWFVGELVRLRDSLRRDETFSLWRQDKREVDLVIERGGRPVWAIELKAGRARPDLGSLLAFREKFPDVSVSIVAADAERPSLVDHQGVSIEVLPVVDALTRFQV